MKNNFQDILLDISYNISNISYDNGDLSDVGNEIGIIIGKYISSDMGYELEDFIHGVKHGVSLIDGTH